MRPSEVETLWKFREALMELYTKVGSDSRDKIYLAYEISDVLKELLEYYDSCFGSELKNE